MIVEFIKKNEMKKYISISIILLIMCVFASTSLIAQFTHTPIDKPLGCINNNEEISFSITVTNLGIYPDGNNFTVWVDNQSQYGSWLNVSPTTFKLYTSGATQIITVSGTYPSDWVTESASTTIHISDNYSNTNYTLVHWTYCGPGGVEDYITIDEGVYEFSENDDLYYKASFWDIDPVPGDPDYVTEWNLNMTLSSNEGEYNYTDITKTYNTAWTDWDFIAPELPDNLQFIRNSEGKIFGDVVISGLDNDGILHSKAKNILINKEPYQPDLFFIPVNASSITLYFLDTRASSYDIYYDIDTGPPYNGTGLLQGNSPIDAGNITSFQVDGFEKCKPYYFSVKGKNDFGESSYAVERKILLFDLPNSLPIYYYLDDYYVDFSYTFTENYYFSGDLVVKSGATVTFKDGDRKSVV